MRRYPLSDLIDASGLTEAALGRLVGLSGSSMKQARNLGLVEAAADRCACRAGLVPWVVWSDWLEDAERVCADTSCGRGFVPARMGTIYCSPTCARRVSSRNHARRRYASDPAYRLRKVERNRRYKDETRKSRQVKQRAYYHANADELRAKRRARYRRQKQDALTLLQGGLTPKISSENVRYLSHLQAEVGA